MRRIHPVLRVAAAAIVLVVLMVALDHQATTLWPPRHPLDRRVTASSAVLRMLSFGMRPLLADYLWIDAVQYFGHTLGMHSHEIVDGAIVERGLAGEDVGTAARTFALLITRLMDVDPAFVRPPLLGAMFLVDPHADPLLGVAILAKASRLNPSSWQVRLYHGFYRYAVLRDREGARAELEAAAACPKRPDYVPGILEFLNTASDSLLARVFYTHALNEARTETERRLYEQRLDELEAGLGAFGQAHAHGGQLHERAPASP